MQDSITRATIERLQRHCLRLWPIIQQHPPGSAGRAAITREFDELPAAECHLCDRLLDRMERVIRFEDAWFPFYQGELDTITPPKKARRPVEPVSDYRQIGKDTRARRGIYARRSS
ncbi:hypothetical protein [Aeromonas eucrenophila]|uniref:Uncharacterized protein n=1 Tax=Aeromonas eucrenophila TaxID=649 RepID=A0ABW0Y9J8_9GAMM|nr:hypothetical protein [Aeromonas eucrenophila]